MPLLLTVAVAVANNKKTGAFGLGHDLDPARDLFRKILSTV